MRQVLITGATGFIGGHLVDRFLANGDHVRALVMPGNADVKKLTDKGVEAIRGDVREYRHVSRVMPGIDVVVHCAAVVTDWAPRREYKEVTVGGTRNICKVACKENVGRVIHISTNDVFGLSEKSIFDESSPRKRWREPYPDYKIKAEEICWLFHQEQRMPLTVIYPCLVYGKNDYTYVADLADAIIKNEMFFWRNHAVIWPTYIDNLVDLIMCASDDDRAIGNGYLVHDGESVTLQAFCRSIAEELGVPPTTKHISFALAYANALLQQSKHKLLRNKKRPLLTTYIVKKLRSRLRFSIAKARIDLDWRPGVPFEDGFKQTMAWLKKADRSRLKTK